MEAITETGPPIKERPLGPGYGADYVKNPITHSKDALL